jgi:glyoxylase-like metal-dependent hydrolase (beta-lactamase superfamily II)
MLRNLVVRLSSALVLSAALWLAYTQTQQAPAQLTLQKVKDDLYVIEGDGGNVTVYLTDEGVILVDDKFERDHDAIMEKVKSITDKPIRYVLNTHHHGDHTGGNQKMPASVEIIAHANARSNMVKGKMPGLPEITFTGESAVHLGGKEAQMRYYGRGHTNGDVVIYFPALRVLTAGDLFTKGDNFPQLIDYGGGGSAIEWIPTIDAILNLDFDTVIPGHGPVSAKQDLKNFQATCQSLNQRVRSMVREGKSKDDISKMLAADFHWGQLQMTRGLDGIIQEMR